MTIKTARVLKKCGIPANILGYEYMGYAIELILADSSLKQGVTKRLYPLIAEKFNTDKHRVERVLRYAIDTAFERMPMSVFTEIFGNTIIQKKGKATNRQFIATVAEYIRLDESTTSVCIEETMQS